MKIAFIVTIFPVLSETFILSQITGLLDLGHEVEIFAHGNLNEGKVHPDVKKYCLMERVHYFDNTIYRSELKRVLKAICLIAVNFHKAPIKILKSINIFKYGGDALSFSLLNKTICFLGREFDIIHCHFGPNGILGTQLKEIGIGGKIITTFYGNDLTSFLQKEGNEVYSNLLACGDLFLPICNYFRKKLLDLNCEQKRVIVHHLGANIECFPFFSKKNLQEESLKMLTVSRLVEKKGHKYALKALAEIIKKHKRIKYIIAGEGPLRSQLKQLVNELRLTEYVEFVGAVNESEVKTLLLEAHFFVLPSVTSSNGEQEGTPTVLVEAQAVGLPVISTYHSGIPEVVIDGKSGLLVPAKDAEALSDRIKYLIEHPEIWAKMGLAGREFVEKYYDAKKLNKQLVQIYKGLLSETS